MVYRTAVFDLDGTLVDSLQDLAETANAMLAASGYPQHPVDAYRYFVGDGMATLIRRIVPPSPTTYTSLGPLPQTAHSCCVVPETIGLQPVPS